MGLRRRRRGHRGLPARQPPQRRSGEPRPAARGRRPRQLSLDPHPGRLSLLHRQPAHRLVFSDRARAWPRRPLDPLPPRKSAGRLLVDQRHDLHARPAAGFRPLAPDGLHRLGLGRRAALFRRPRGPLDGPRLRRRRPAWRGRRVAHRGAACPLGDSGRLPRRLRTGRYPEGRRLQRRRQFRLVLFPRDAALGVPLERRQGVFASGAEPPEPARRHGRARDAHRDGAGQGERPRPDRRRPARPRPAARRTGAGRRRHRDAATPAALGHRTGRAAGQARHRPGAARAPRSAGTCRTISSSAASTRCKAPRR